jgi:hypothetical protein
MYFSLTINKFIKKHKKIGQAKKACPIQKGGLLESLTIIMFPKNYKNIPITIKEN